MRQLTRQEIYDHLLQEGYVPVTDLGDKWEKYYTHDIEWVVRSEKDTIRIYVDKESMYFYILDDLGWDLYTTRGIEKVVIDDGGIYKLTWLEQNVNNIYVDEEGVVYKKNKIDSVFWSLD